jgi:hypothetical protein
MSLLFSSSSIDPVSESVGSDMLADNTHHERPPLSAALMAGEVILETRSHSAWGGAVTAKIYFPLNRSQVWKQLTDYPRWVHYFPDIVCSEVLPPAVSNTLKPASKRLYQVAKKAFLFLSVQVEVYLNVFESVQQEIKFRLESGSFVDFTADLKLQDAGTGTILTYSVQATPTIPVPSILIEQAMQFDLPTNLRKMRQIICSSGGC